LGRVLVVVYEAEGEAREHGVEGETFGRKYLWKREVVRVDEGVEEEQEEGKMEEQFEIGDEDSEEGNDDDDDEEGVKAFKDVKGKPPVQSEEPLLNGSEEMKDPLTSAVEDMQQKVEGAEEVEKEEEEKGLMPCLVDRLFSCTVDLLFCAGFTVPENVRTEDGSGEKINVSG
jgi:hypothetical protein